MISPAAIVDTRNCLAHRIAILPLSRASELESTIMGLVLQTTLDRAASRRQTTMC
jgi:hypothetical protein